MYANPYIPLVREPRISPHRHSKPALQRLQDQESWNSYLGIYSIRMYAYLCMCIYICIHIYIYIYICVCPHKHAQKSVWVCIYIDICTEREREGMHS